MLRLNGPFSDAMIVRLRNVCFMNGASPSMISPVPLYNLVYSGTGAKYKACDRISTIIPLIKTVYSTEHAVPAYLAVEETKVFVK